MIDWLVEIVTSTWTRGDVLAVATAVGTTIAGIGAWRSARIMRKNQEDLTSAEPDLRIVYPGRSMDEVQQRSNPHLRIVNRRSQAMFIRGIHLFRHDGTGNAEPVMIPREFKVEPHSERHQKLPKDRLDDTVYIEVTVVTGEEFKLHRTPPTRRANVWKWIKTCIARERKEAQW